jgi:two-component system cell cycle sensor histidine kinase PleC
MPSQRPTNIDKNIVDRTRARRNSDVARAVRRTRDRLSERAGNPVYDRELLKLHADATAKTALAIPLLVLAICVAGFFAGVGADIGVWAVVTMACYGGLSLVARRVARTDTPDIETDKVRRAFLIAHAVSGLGWAYFAWLGCEECQIEQFLVLKAVILLLVMAATAIIASALRGALIATFAIPVAAFGIHFALSPVWEPVDAIMVALLLASLPFFTYVAGHLHSSAMMLLSFRAEKDMLIAELETAKAMSDEARRRAEEANLAKSRFLATMSHELRTPLNAILGFSEVMASEVLGPLQNPTYKEYAGDIHASGKHLLHLINEILDLSRIEAGRYQLNEEPIVLEHVVEECCHLMELKARNKDIRIVQEFEPDLPRLFADERSLRQITLNLLSNAVKFAPSGSEVRVRLGWTAGGGQYVSIRDNGPGIPEDEIPVVLSAFGQGSIAIKSAEEGTGLGLPIVQGLVALHGGEFKLHSRLREGTEAIAIFPPQRVMEELPPMPQERRRTAAYDDYRRSA